MGDTPTGLRLPQELADRLTEIAASKKISRSALIRMVLQAYVDGDQTAVVATGSQGVDQAARDALQTLLGRVQALEENSSVLMKSTQQNFDLLEDKAALSEFRALEESVHQLQTILHVRDASESKGKPDLDAFEAAMRKAQESPKPKPEAKDWAAQFNS